MPKEHDPERTADMVLAEIETKLATIDGISTADAFALGRLVMEYGDARAAKGSAAVLFPLLDKMMEPRPPKPPWKADF